MGGEGGQGKGGQKGRSGWRACGERRLVHLAGRGGGGGGGYPCRILMLIPDVRISGGCTTHCVSWCVGWPERHGRLGCPRSAQKVLQAIAFVVVWRRAGVEADNVEEAGGERRGGKRGGFWGEGDAGLGTSRCVLRRVCVILHDRVPARLVGWGGGAACLRMLRSWSHGWEVGWERRLLVGRSGWCADVE